MPIIKRFLWPLGSGFAGSVLLAAMYFGIVAWAESPQHAVDLFWEQRWITTPILLGFGIQVALYVVIKKRLFMPVGKVGPSGVLAGAGGATSTAAMVACCAHHITDVLPILGLSAAAAFLAEYQTAFMLVGLATTLLGIVIMLVILYRERRKVIRQWVIEGQRLAKENL
jgi:hypothetical protein